MTAAVRANIATYVGGAFSPAGARAKTLSFLLSRNQTGTAIDDLEGDLEDDIATSAPITGRLVDAAPNNTSPLTQAFAANALDKAGSTLADDALSFLLKQQCLAGFFRDSFSPEADVNQTCDLAAGATGSVDTTALAVLLLQNQKSEPTVAASLTKAVDWLATQQHADGSFDGFAGPNANTTGLAGWAFGVSGRAAAAAKAASWLRARQLANAGTCTKFAARDNGGIAVDDLGVTNASPGPLSDIDNDPVTRATAQALPALLWAPGGAAAGDTKLTGPGEFVKAGTAQSVAVVGAPGNTLCITVGSTSSRVVLDANGAATVPVTMPPTTADVTVTTVDAGGETDTLTITGLAKAKLKAKGPATVKLGATFTVKFTGLEPGESVVVKYLGKKVKKAKSANAKGVVKVKLKATKLGKATIKIKGQYGNRKGTKVVRVSR